MNHDNTGHLSRRRFLKTTAAIGVASALAG
jgi:nitrous oxide reductase